ncbi:MAG: 2-polyprenyl-3-methyl-6-methoxy-1,4-benzoquinone monooxygenase [Immundisolibacteraceae bacterium]|nr:2-polyprenyl-3-methyl-6-methoxy-1,4-benzoquinone monooxygenase [Immundisolibacteraceae bacterium]
MADDLRRYSRLDRALSDLQKLFKHRPGSSSSTSSPTLETPASDELSESEINHSAALMRVNHAGEIAAQGLYTGQAVTARQQTTRTLLENAGQQEQQHLQWCSQRLQELNSGPSKLAPLWFTGSVALGMLNGLAGDRWSLGFVAETERQVEKHLAGHLNKLPAQDHRSRTIVKQMLDDEVEHGHTAIQAGGRPLPWPVRLLMKASAKVMTSTAYRF